MNRYDEMIQRQQEEFNAFPLGAAFNDEQFAEMMEKWGLTANDTDKIVRLGDTGCFLRKSDREEFWAMRRRHDREMREAIAADEDGTGFIYEMFRSELDNHEYRLTLDMTDALEALGMTLDEVKEDAKLTRGLLKARREIIDEARL